MCRGKPTKIALFIVLFARFSFVTKLPILAALRTSDELAFIKYPDTQYFHTHVTTALQYLYVHLI